MKQLDKKGLMLILVSIATLSSVIAYQAATISGSFLSNWSPITGGIGLFIIFALCFRMWMYNLTLEE